MILLKPLQIKAGGAYGSIKTAKKKIIFDYLKKKKKKKKKKKTKRPFDSVSLAGF